MGRPPCCDEKGLKKGPWTPEEDHKLMNYIQKNGHGSWRALPELAGTSTVSCISVSRALNFHEKRKEKENIVQHIFFLAGLNRCGKSCRLRWTNYLRPDIKRGKFSKDEEQTILHLHSILGNKY